MLKLLFLDEIVKNFFLSKIMSTKSSKFKIEAMCFFENILARLDQQEGLLNEANEKIKILNTALEPAWADLPPSKKTKMVISLNQCASEMGIDLSCCEENWVSMYLIKCSYLNKRVYNSSQRISCIDSPRELDHKEAINMDQNQLVGQEFYRNESNDA